MYKLKNKIKIPNKTIVLYCNKKNVITIIGPINTKSLKLQVTINVIPTEKLVIVNTNPLFKMATSKKKKLLAIQGTTIALIKQTILETSCKVFKKLKLIGVGYRIFSVEDFNDRLLFIKLGYSHKLYFKIPLKLKTLCLKRTKLFLYGNSYQLLAHTASYIRSYKKPEPYKGKGILYENEKIILKEGKKI